MQLVLKSHLRLILFCCELFATNVRTGEYTSVSTFLLGEKTFFGGWRTLYGSDSGFSQFKGFYTQGQRHIVGPKTLDEARKYHSPEFLMLYSLPDFNLLRSEYLLEL